jgi:protein TonB
MAIYKKHVLPVQTSLMFAVLSTAIIFTLLPLLSKYDPASTDPIIDDPIFVPTIKPPPPSDVERNMNEPDKPKEMIIRETQTKNTAVAPEIEYPDLVPEADILERIVLVHPEKDIDIVTPDFRRVLELSQVDQKPVIIRSFQPEYPLLAKQNNIEGAVTLRFVVDKNGYVRDPEVYKAEPEAVFEEAALTAIARYKFRPAIKDGEAVDCIVRLAIIFDLR